jgi:predicted ATP-grasp superfamily ATP-dependent carboligase
VFDTPTPSGSTRAVGEVSRVGGLVLGGDYQGLAIARSLGRSGFPVVVLDDEHSIARVSRYVRRYERVPDLRGERAIVDAVVDAGRRFGLRGWVLFPTRDEQVAAISRYRDELTDRFRVPTPGWEAVRRAWDKRETYEHAQVMSVPIPSTWFPRTEAELLDIPTDHPLVVKPAIKEHFFYDTGVKAWRVEGPEALARRFRDAADLVEDGEVIVQEMIPGDGSNQFSYCALFKDGRGLAEMTVCRRRQHPSDLGRASTFVETVTCPQIVEPSRRFLEAIGYYGLVEMEYKRDPVDGQFKLLDVNARTWGYHSLGPAAGVDFPALLMRDQMGEIVTPVTARPGVRWIRLVTDVPNAFVDARAGRIRWSAYLRTLRGVDTEAVFSLRDPAPGLYELALLPYLFVKRGL